MAGEPIYLIMSNLYSCGSFDAVREYISDKPRSISTIQALYFNHRWHLHVYVAPSTTNSFVQLATNISTGSSTDSGSHFMFIKYALVTLKMLYIQTHLPSPLNFNGSASTSDHFLCKLSRKKTANDGLN